MISILTDIITSIQIDNLLEVVALIVCIFLMSSPGIAFTAIGVSAKLGLFAHVREPEDVGSETEEAE